MEPRNLGTAELRNARFFLFVTLAVAAAWPLEAGAARQADEPPGRLERVLVAGTDERIVVRLIANRTINGLLELTRDEPRRLFIDLAGVRPATASAIAVNRDLLLKQVRVALHSKEPLVTRVVFDIVGEVRHHLEYEMSGRELRVIIEATTGDDAAAEYAAWFEKTASRVEALLEEPPEDHSVWQALSDEIADARVPEAMRQVHALLVEAVRLGGVQSTRRVGGRQVPLRSDESAAAASGARMLLAQARAALGQLKPGQ